METIAELEHKIAKLRTSEAYWRRSALNNYSRLRELENKVRKAALGSAEKGAYDTLAHERLANLLRYVPKNPRKTVRELRKRQQRMNIE